MRDASFNSEIESESSWFGLANVIHRLIVRNDSMIWIWQKKRDFPFLRRLKNRFE